MARSEYEIERLQLRKVSDGGYVLSMDYTDGKGVMFTIDPLTKKELDRGVSILGMAVDAIRQQLATNQEARRSD